ncbi:MAG TPA: hypothetical protein VHW91_04855 [Candidatus Dormibacteraeota bacterium]|nr:hypothetical protein [Candidatus Dormibacteraeota bacterium]
MLLVILLGAAGALALGAVVVGMLWLVQFVVGNEERGRDLR